MQWITNTKRLPKGSIGPSTTEIVEMYFLTYPYEDCLDYIAAGKKVKPTTTFKEITERMRWLHERDLNNGTLGKLYRNRTINKTRQSTKKKRGDEHHRGRKDDHLFNKHPYKLTTKNRRFNKGDLKQATYFHKDKKDCPKQASCAHTWEDCHKNPKSAKYKASCKNSFKTKEEAKAFLAQHADDVNNDAECSATTKTSITDDDNVESVHDNDDNEAEELPKETYVMEITRKAKEIDGDGVSKKPKVLTSKQRK